MVRWRNNTILCVHSPLYSLPYHILRLYCIAFDVPLSSNFFLKQISQVLWLTAILGFFTLSSTTLTL